jgi:DNA-binding transcriptional MerR regulator
MVEALKPKSEVVNTPIVSCKMPLNTAKYIKKYFAISEVAAMFNVSETLLRYWEKEFPSIQPRKGGRNIRQYTQEDIEEIRVIHNMVKVRGMKLAAAREALAKNRQRESGTTELMNRLLDIREQLVSLRKELDEIV